MGAVVQATPVPSDTKGLIPKSDLRPGDVLLSCGDEALSELIRRIDGGLYSHAAVWDGQYAVDATASGVKRRPLEQDEDAQVFIDAYRWHAALPGDDPDLGDARYPPGPVLAETDKIVEQGTQFAYDQLLLAALVIWVSKQPKDRWLRAAARLLLSRVEVWLVEKIRKPGKQSMVCSETVALSFDEPVPPPPPDYTINVIVDGSRDASAITDAVEADRPASGGVDLALKTSVSSYEDLKRRFGELLLSDKTDDEKARLLAFASAQANTDAETAHPMPTGNGGLPPSCVTPHDLERSPNLRLLGRLSKKAAPSLPQSTFLLFLMVLKEYLGSEAKRILAR